MVEFNFKMSDVDAENFLNIIKSDKSKMLQYKIKAMAEKDKVLENYYQKQADYSEELYKIVTSQVKIV